MAATAVKSVHGEWSNGVKILKVAFTAHTDNSNATATLTGCAGKKLKGCVMVNGSTGQGNAADLDVTDTLSGINLTATTGDNKLTANSVTAFVALDTAVVGWICLGDLTVTISGNTIASGTCDVYIILDGIWD
jgi:hypothetical protein